MYTLKTISRKVPTLFLLLFMGTFYLFSSVNVFAQVISIPTVSLPASASPLSQAIANDSFDTSNQSSSSPSSSNTTTPNLISSAIQSVVQDAVKPITTFVEPKPISIAPTVAVDTPVKTSPDIYTEIEDMMNKKAEKKEPMRSKVNPYVPFNYNAPPETYRETLKAPSTPAKITTPTPTPTPIPMYNVTFSSFWDTYMPGDDYAARGFSARTTRALSATSLVIGSLGGVLTVGKPKRFSFLLASLLKANS